MRHLHVISIGLSITEIRIIHIRIKREEPALGLSSGERRIGFAHADYTSGFASEAEHRNTTPGLQCFSHHSQFLFPAFLSSCAVLRAG